MRSRYDYMEQGSVKDPITGSFYPDPLTLNYKDLKLNRVPIAKELSSSQIIRFPVTVFQEYGENRLDDMILSLNGIPHQNFLYEGSRIYFPALSDIETSFKQNR